MEKKKLERGTVSSYPKGVLLPPKGVWGNPFPHRLQQLDQGGCGGFSPHSNARANRQIFDAFVLFATT
jgi:hypothetical protein